MPNDTTFSEAIRDEIRFQEEYDAKYPKAVARLTRDVETLFTYMEYPAAHWLHWRNERH